jgi:beta-glucosidase
MYYNAYPSRGYWAEQGWSSTGGYVDGTSGPLFAFGHGLSYTTFDYGDLTIELSAEQEAVAHVSAVVTNAGAREGSEVVQLYISDRFSSVTTPVKELRGFSKVRLRPGESRVVQFTLTASDLALLDAEGSRVLEAGVFDIMVGSSSADIRLRGELEVAHEKRLPGKVHLSSGPLDQDASLLMDGR